MNKSIIGAALALMLAAPSLHAVQAKRGVTSTYTQPDGTTLTVTLTGDERSHCYLTTDGLPLMEDGNGGLFYALTDADGRAVASKFLARNAADRTGAETAVLRTVDKDIVRRALLAERLEASPKLNRAERNIRNLAKSPAKVTKSSGIGLYDDIFPHEGTVHSLVIIVEYKDVKFKVDDPHDFFTRMLNEEGFSDYGGTGSARDYFVENSNNRFRPTFDVYGPVTLPENMKYYGGNDRWGEDQAPEYMVKHACEILDDEVNFADYDLDNDGKVDNIFIIYAGQGEASGGDSNTVWPHQWDLSIAGLSPVHDGKKIDHYACTNEWESDRPDGIGTFVHEFSHVMGLPDLYTTDYGSASSLTPGEWSVLDYGPYNNDGRTPPAYSIFERNAMGWIDPIVLDGEAHITLEHILKSNQGAIKLTDSKNEFFLFENRQQEGWDTYIPGHGMLIWHIDYNQAVWATSAVNNTSTHQYVDIEEANGRANNSNFNTMAGYAFPGTSKNTSFTDDTTPSMITWKKARLETPITDITEENGVISFDVCGGVYELTAPVVKAADITPEGFTLSWNAIEGANQYEALVYSTPELSIPVTSATTSATAVTINGLEPLTQYYAVVYALRGNKRSDASEAVSVATGEYDFTYYVPRATEATEIAEYSFVANWEEVEGAVDYLLTVNVESGAPETVYNGFGTGATITLPAGWTTNIPASDKYTSKEYSGSAVPSIKLSRSMAYLETPVYSSDITTVSFWARQALGSNQTSTDSYLTVYGRADEYEEWYTVALCREITAASGGEQFSFDNIPAGTRTLRFEYTKVTGNLALDDITLTVGNTSFDIVGAYDHVSIGSNATSMLVYVDDRVNNESRSERIEKCGYTVKAVDAQGRVSRESNRVEVTMAVSGISDVVNSSAPVEYFNLQGIRIAEPSDAGVYIRRQGSEVRKVEIK